jgi:hypothetical protein
MMKIKDSLDLMEKYIDGEITDEEAIQWFSSLRPNLSPHKRKKEAELDLLSMKNDITHAESQAADGDIV